MRYAAEAGNISVTVAGDTILNRKLSQFTEDGFLRMVRLLRDSTVTLGNLESLYHDWEMSYGSNYINAYQVGRPEMLDEVKWLGFDAMSIAMNHAFDCGEAGLLATLDNCKKHGLTVAGGGRSLAEARTPAYIETPAGRVALLSSCTTFRMTELSHAGPGRHDFPGKPGISVLRHDTICTVPGDVFDACRTMGDGLGLREPSGDDELTLFGRVLRRGDGYAENTYCNKADLDGIGRSVRGAKKAADLVAYSVHCHESGTEGPYYNTVHRPSTPEFLVEFAHFLIDNGCDVVYGHGPHILRGIEIYKGKPIFYSLGDFVFNVESLERVPPPAYTKLGLGDEDTPGDWAHFFAEESSFAWAAEPACYQSVIATCDFLAGELQSVKLHPIDLGYGTPLSQRGRPVLATAETAAEIRKWVTRVCEPFGTTISAPGEGLVQFIDD